MRSLLLRHIEFSLLAASAFLMIVAVYFTPHVWRHDEAREALVIEDIVENHHWLLPVRNYELPSKPILYHWISAGVATVLGISDFTVRSPSVLGALVMVWLTYRLGTFTGERKLPWLAVIVLGTTYEFWDSGTEARVDMLFAALIGGALMSWYVWYRTGAELARATVYLSIALATLTKGPAGAALPILVIGSFLLLERNGTRLLKFISWYWLTSAAALVVGWYFAAYYLGRDDFFHKQIVFENVDRFFGSGDFHTHKHLFSQAHWFVTQLFPWSLVLLLTFWRRLCGEPVDSFKRFLYCWWLAVFGFFLLARGQRAVYLLPMYPAVALLAAAECVALWRYYRGLPLFSASRWTWRSAAAMLVAIDITFAVSVPISRTVQEDTNRQEEFIENVVATLPPGAGLQATTNFPDTVLMVLAFRLRQNIPRQPACNRSSRYYLTRGEPSDCAAGNAPVLTAGSSSRGQYLALLGPSR
jgi:4-amino-4-deoxy-L-arabinose transferase-like glycosyltransferase